MDNSLTIDARALKELGVDLKRAAYDLEVEIPVELAQDAIALGVTSRDIALAYTPYGQDPSSGETTQAVAQSIHAEPVSSHTWRVSGSQSIPLAGLWEFGNKGSGDHETEFRHPVFGNMQTWASQRKWPYFTMAMKREEPVIFERFAALLDHVLHRHRL
jgi:hypothetical protein